MSEGLQELAALGIVALVVGVTLWRRRQRRKAGTAGCDGCDKPAKPAAREATLHFHRRRP